MASVRQGFEAGMSGNKLHPSEITRGFETNQFLDATGSRSRRAFPISAPQCNLLIAHDLLSDS